MAHVIAEGDPTAGGFTVRQPGWYDLRIEDAELVPTKSGSRQIKIRAVELSPNEGARATVFISLHEKMFRALLDFMLNSGIEFEQVSEGRIEFNTEDFVGQIVCGRVENQEWQGRMREQWAEWQVSKYRAQPPQQPPQQPRQQPPQAQPQAQPYPTARGPYSGR